MKLLLDAIFFAIIGYYLFLYLQMLFRLERNIIFPLDAEDLKKIRKHPEKELYLPTFSEQKVGIILYSLMLVFVIAMFFWSYTMDEINWSLYFMILIPMTSPYELINLFAITNEGILSGIRFIPWNRIKSYEFIPVDMNHRFFGYAKEVNHGYELKIKSKTISFHCVIISEEMKEKLTNLFQQYKERAKEDEKSVLP